MTRPPRPLLVVTLPARNPEEARREAAAAAVAGADVAEVRLDRFADASAAAMRRLFPTPLPLVATLRSRTEGGGGPDGADARAAWLREAIRLPFAYVDLEHDRDLAPDGSVPGTGDAVPIVSSHLRAGTGAAALDERLRDGGAGSAIRKLVVSASVDECLTTIEPRAARAPPARRIVLTTGPSGPLLRAWSRRLGLFGVYAALPEAPDRPAAVEPSQIPIDRLRPFLEADDDPPLFAVVGRPIGHSRSPALHHRWMREDGRVGLYVALEVGEPAELARAAPRLAERGVRGLNATHPLKDALLALATRATPRAERCGCANTLTFDGDRIEADNTDVLAIRRRLDELVQGGRWTSGRLLVVGTGGAARATLVAASERGWIPTVLARDRATARALVDRLGGTVAEGAGASPAELVVHATTVGRGSDGTLAVDLRPWLGRSTHLVDWVYRSDRPIVPDLAAAAGATYEDGARLLGFAAAASYERWWGGAITVDRIDRAVAEAM